VKPAGPGNEGFYNIENVHCAMSLEIVNASKEPEAEIVQRPYGPGPLDRQWEPVPVTGKVVGGESAVRRGGCWVRQARQIFS
jgi:hypothetical protein